MIMTTIGNRIQAVRCRIDTACAAAGRPPGSVQLLAVTKTVAEDGVREAIAAGQLAFGENYLQEGVGKIEALGRGGNGSDPAGRPEVVWHCIGPIQSNKTRLAAAHFDWVQSVDRLKIAERLSEQRPGHLAPLNVCLQVNIDGGANKSGVQPADLRALALAVAALPRIRLRGIMTIPEPQPDRATQLRLHGEARALFDALVQGDGLPLDTLSMGMSDDLEAAVEAGSTLVRVGSAIFGVRVKNE
jgi:pyridoxal phosphate enzyme (YggS family)